MDGLRERYGARAALYTRQVDEELQIIAEVGYDEYFLVVWGILQQCRERGIEWITRGSAADSLVCYCLRISVLLSASSLITALTIRTVSRHYEECLGMASGQKIYGLSLGRLAMGFFRLGR